MHECKRILDIVELPEDADLIFKIIPIDERYYQTIIYVSAVCMCV